jgi:siroheme synthase-like protein
VAHAYPILLDLAGKLIVIAGGGKVAVRKARGVLEAGATKVKCIAPQIDPEMPASVEKITRKFAEADVQEAALIFAATDSPEVNTAIVRLARERGILVCRADADDEDCGDFSVPAVWRNGPIVVSVAAGSPALSAALRDDLRMSFVGVGEYKEMAELMRKLRPWLRNCTKLSPGDRRAALVNLASRSALDALASGGEDALWQWLLAHYPQLEGEKRP